MGINLIGVEIDPTIAASATGLRDPYGIIVAARAAGATSDVALMARDIIRSVNNRRVPTLDALRDSLRALTPGASVVLQIQRDGRLLYVPFIFE